MGLPGAGTSVGHFEILERLGGGGMGVVYKARDLRLGRLVALKFMAPTRQDSQEARVRFLREAQAVAALDHPNVCTLYEIGEEEDGRIFLAMALCQGETLKERLRRGPLPPREAVQIALQIGDGLAAAHARGIVHRDIKPANLLLCDGLVKIIDFGVARLGDQTTITREGVAVGTLNYTAPEHLFGGEPGPESDLWSLGVVLYESIAGRLPFQARTLPEMIVALLKKTPAPLEGVSPELCRIVERAMARSPRERYQSAEEIQADLLAAMASVTDLTCDLHAPTIPTEPAIRQKGSPLLHNLPFPPLGELLKGRNDDLAALENALDETGLRSYVLHGLGGIGKTRLAVEYAWKHGRRYRAVLFVLAESPEGLNSGLASLARAEVLSLPERADPAEVEVTAAVLRWLRENPRWLLILDNVDTKETLLAVTRLLPSLAEGRVLITSRRQDWPPAIHKQSLDVIPLPAATDFLLKRTAKERWKKTDDVPQALRLAELLDGLPLALEQAAAYIAHTQISIVEYLEIWEKECDSALSWYDEGIMQYPASLAVTWQGTFRQLTLTAKATLRLMANFSPEPIPVDMVESGTAIIREAAQHLGGNLQERPVREDLGELAAVSLISRRGSVLSVHPMVQEVIRQRIPKEEQQMWIEKALYLVEQYAPEHPEDVRTWSTWELLRAHVTQLLTSALSLGLWHNRSVLRLQAELGLFLYGKGLYSESQPLLLTACEADEQIYGENGHELPVSLNNYAQLLKAMGRLDEAEARMRRALGIARASLDSQHPLLSRFISGLAVILMELGEWSEAEALIREALGADVKVGDRSGEARDLHNLALLLNSTGRIQEAETLIRQALEIAFQTYGVSHPRTARRMQILASILKALGRFDEALPIAIESLEIFEQVLGPHHPRTLSARQDLEALKQNGEASGETSPLDR